MKLSKKKLLFLIIILPLLVISLHVARGVINEAKTNHASELQGSHL